MLLEYASRVARHTLSPLNANSWVIEPPIPQDHHMRMSSLFIQDSILAQQRKKLEVDVGEGDKGHIGLDFMMDIDHYGEKKEAKEASEELLDLDVF